MYAGLFPYVFGVLLAWLTVWPKRRLTTGEEIRFLRWVMVAVAAAFVGFPMSSGDAAGVQFELQALVVFAVVLAASWRSPRLVAVAFLLHGAWDLVFLLEWVEVDKPLWLVQLCVPYDWAIGGYVALRLAPTRLQEAS